MRWSGVSNRSGCASTARTAPSTPASAQRSTTRSSPARGTSSARRRSSCSTISTRFRSGPSRPSLVVVDEAHHLFESTHRPAYQRLGAAIGALGAPQVLALTATAGDDAFERIRDALGIDAWVIDPTVRDNLHIVDARGTADKVAYIERFARTGEKAIVYCNSRSESSKTADKLRRTIGGDIVAFYHAGVGSAERAQVERYFREGVIRVVVATSAFGEGIDLPDVRHVFLYHLNFDFTEFNQQAGRAGRDGGDASIHLLFGEKDRNLNDFIIERGAPTLPTLRRLYAAMKAMTSGGTLRMPQSEIAAMLDFDRVDGSSTVGAADPHLRGRRVSWSRAMTTTDVTCGSCRSPAKSISRRPSATPKAKRSAKRSRRSATSR